MASGPRSDVAWAQAQDNPGSAYFASKCEVCAEITDATIRHLVSQRVENRFAPERDI
jgi:hypothetical protein